MPSHDHQLLEELHLLVLSIVPLSSAAQGWPIQRTAYLTAELIDALIDGGSHASSSASSREHAHPSVFNAVLAILTALCHATREEFLSCSVDGADLFTQSLDERTLKPVWDDHDVAVADG